MCGDRSKMDYFCNLCLTELNIPLLLSSRQQTVPTINLKRAFITSCKHVYCQVCIQKVNDKCIICKQNCRSIEINDKSSIFVRNYFENIEIIQKNTMEYIRFTNEQHKIRYHRVQQFGSRYQKLYEEEKANCGILKRKLDHELEKRKRLSFLCKLFSYKL